MEKIKRGPKERLGISLHLERATGCRHEFGAGTFIFSRSFRCVAMEDVDRSNSATLFERATRGSPSFGTKSDYGAVAFRNAAQRRRNQRLPQKCRRGVEAEN